MAPKKLKKTKVTDKVEVDEDRLLNSEEDEITNGESGESDNDIGEDMNSQRNEFLASNEFKKIVDDAIKEQLSKLKSSGNSSDPPFFIRKFAEHERLSGHKNFKSWRSMIDTDLQALGLLKFIESSEGDSRLTDERNAVKSAQALLYVRASTVKNIAINLQKIANAYDAVVTLTNLYGANEVLDSVDLYARTERLRFLPGYSQIRFVTDFENIIAEYEERETFFDESFLKSMFLQKIDGIRDSKSPFFAFFNTVTVLPAEVQTLEYIKQKFLAVDLRRPNDGTRDRKDDQRKRKIDDERRDSSNRKSDDSRQKKKVRADEEKPANTEDGKRPRYTREQIDRLKKSTPEEKRKLQCNKCGQYFHHEKQCPNPGRQCFRCYRFGHQGKECPKTDEKI